jgi:uncharacterized membrane protein YidH (DUF202 family)
MLRSSLRLLRPARLLPQRRRAFWLDSTVDNTGSIALDILATERTFLAWARTGLGFVSAGSAMFAAYHRQDDAPPMEAQIIPACLLLMGNGAFLLLFATRRYIRVVQHLQSNRFPIDTKGTLLAVFWTAATTVTSMGLVVHAEFGHTKTKGEEQQRDRGN